MKFTDFHVTASLCTPSRASLITGRYAQRVGLPKVLFPGSVENKHSSGPQKGLAIKRDYYRTGFKTRRLFNLLHRQVAPRWQKRIFCPQTMAFDGFFGLPYSNDMAPPEHPDLPLMQNENVIEKNPNQDFLTQRYTKAAIEFINKNRNQPFSFILPIRCRIGQSMFRRHLQKDFQKSN